MKQMSKVADHVMNEIIEDSGDLCQISAKKIPTVHQSARMAEPIKAHQKYLFLGISRTIQTSVFR